MRILTRFLAASAALLLPLAGMGVNAQVPEDSTLQAQVAAVALTTSDLPTGYSLVGETFLPLPSDLDGVTAHYVSVYTNTESGEQIRSYVYGFASEEQAQAGFAALESEDTDTLSDEALDLGSGESELTTGTYQNANDEAIGTADATFVQGALVLGVAVDSGDDTAVDPQLARDLAATVDTRAQAVVAGDTTLDLSLPAKIVPIASGGTVLQAGFITASEAEAIYGTQGSAIASADTTYVQTIGYGEGGAAPRVTIGLSTYASTDDAARVVEQADQIIPPLADQEQVEDIAVDGAESVVAYRYTSRDGATSSRESFRIIFSQGETVTVVDVQGAPDSETAQAAANAITAPQLTCQAEGTCERPVADGVIPGE